MTNPTPVRSPRLLLWLTFIHTIPVIWLTPVVAGTAPTAALLAFAIASLFTFDLEGAALGLMVGLPALLYAALAWVLAWVLDKITRRLPTWVHHCAIALLVAAPLLSVYFPIYVAGGHNASSRSNLFEFLDGYLSDSVVLSYWLGLHAVVLALYVYRFVPPQSTLGLFIHQWRKAIVAAIFSVGVASILYGTYPVSICRPLAELGNNAAQLCVARNSRVEQRYWYERAALDGDAEALTWLIDNTPDRAARLTWLRMGAEDGHAPSQYGLYQHLSRDLTTQAEALEWLRRAAQGDYGPAQHALAEAAAETVYRQGSNARLVEYHTWLERAAEQGTRISKWRLAQHYARGSMGYAVDHDRARQYYQELASSGTLSEAEKRWQITQSGYQERVDELDAWAAGLANNDVEVMRTLADLYRNSQFPGPGVSELAQSLLERVAEVDSTARDELIVSLRTGTGGLTKDVAAAREWLLQAAREGDRQAMQRVAHNSMSGREGFTVDYPEARRWLERLITLNQTSGEARADKRVAKLRSELNYLDRLAEMAGGELLGPAELEALEGSTDAPSHYRFALQLLAGYGTTRRAVAVGRLQAAANLGYGAAAWRLVEIYERGFPGELDQALAQRQLQRAVDDHHFDATRELASRYEYGKKGYAQDLPRAIAMYEAALAAGRDNRHGWNLDPDKFNHFPWLESRLRQARGKLEKLNARADVPAAP